MSPTSKESDSSAGLIANALDILDQHLLTAAIVKFGRPAVSMASDSLCDLHSSPVFEIVGGAYLRSRFHRTAEILSAKFSAILGAAAGIFSFPRIFWEQYYSGNGFLSQNCLVDS